MSNEMNTQEEKKVLTQKDLNKAMFRWYMSAEMPLNFENMQGIAFCGSISHILKKLYTKKEDLSEALKRHLLLYNCNVTAGGLILEQPSQWKSRERKIHLRCLIWQSQV